ncbi:MAG: septum formation initiator family protein [Candidatus Marinimicrobia bacterium]|nr:septum formation initiator family protein [Candidatus Neomarinimicrobiota bacterium]|tara:strand:- start:2837 stop:3118 length:282 start_codon:yes stop_codon:yes gene_type:complete
MNFKIPSLTNVLFGCLSVGCILLLLFSDRGFLTLWNLKKEKIEIQQDINSLRQQISSLEKEAEKLEFDEKYIEKIAREKFRMSKPGEKVFKVE